jgi:parallel beta-helix repeat protein
VKKLVILVALALVASLLVFYGGQTAKASHAAPGPAAYWPFDEGIGTTATDVAHSNDGTISGATYTGGGVDAAPVPGNLDALHFASSGDLVRVPDDVLLRPATVTVSAWARNHGTPTSFDYVLAKTLDGGKASYALYTSGSGGLFFYVSDSTNFYLSDDAGVSIWDGSWHHIAGIYDGFVVRLLVDGSEIGTANPGPAAIAYGTSVFNGDLSIGSYGNIYSPLADWRGDIDEVRIYDRALSDDEVKSLYLTGDIGTLFVDDDGEVGLGTSVDCDGTGVSVYDVIQDAVDAAGSGDTISVCPGTYTENVDVTKDDLTIVSTGGSSVTTVDGSGAADEVFEIIADDVTIMGFEIKKGGSDGGIRFRGNDNVFAYNDVHDNSLYGIVAWDLGVPTSDRNIIRNNHIHHNLRSGVLIGAGGNVGNVVTQNQVFDNDQGGGFVNIELVNNYRGNVTRNNVYSTFSIRSGILLFNWRVDVPVGENTVAQNNVHKADGATDGGHSFAGIEVLSWTSGGSFHGFPCDDADQDNNKIMRNSVHDNPGSGILLWSIADCNKPGDVPAVASVDGNTVERNTVHSNGAYGIRLIDADNNNIVFNRVHDNELDGILLQASDGNTIDNNRVDTNGRDGIRLDVGSSGNAIQQNHMNGNAEYDAHDLAVSNTWVMSGRQRNKCSVGDPSGLCVD